MATSDSADPLLTLTTLEPERPVVVIDGVRYHLALPDDFSVVDHARLLRIQRRVQRLTEDDLTEEEAAEAARALRELARMILPDCPEDVLGRLKDGQLVRLVGVFTQAVGGGPPPAEAQRARRTGARSSPGSSATTEATP